MSKYEVLWNYIKDNNKASYIMTFDEIKNIFRV
ncbi:unknown [Mycoplasma sp. CAG:611]|nr:unknown [Mycoplasma sp. CAG:611]